MDTLAADAPTIRLTDIASGYRRSSRSVIPLRSRVLINIPGQAIVRGHTLDIAENRLTVSVPTALCIGQQCSVFLALSIANQTFTIVGASSVQGCALGESSYNVDLNLTVTDKRSLIAIEQLFGSRRSNCIQ